MVFFILKLPTGNSARKYADENVALSPPRDHLGDIGGYQRISADIGGYRPTSVGEHRWTSEDIGGHHSRFRRIADDFHGVIDVFVYPAQ